MNNLAILYEQYGKIEEAEKYYLESVEKNCEGAEKNLLMFYNSTNQIEKAKDLYMHLAWKNDTDAMNRLRNNFWKRRKFRGIKKMVLKGCGIGR